MGGEGWDGIQRNINDDNNNDNNNDKTTNKTQRMTGLTVFRIDLRKVPLGRFPGQRFLHLRALLGGHKAPLQ